MAIYNERIRNLRVHSGLTLKEIANKLHTTEATAQRYESGKGIKSIPYEKILEYAEIFDVTPEYIMGWNPPLENIDTDIQVEIMSDPELNAHVEKLAKLTASKQIIYDMIDMYYEKENGQ